MSDRGGTCVSKPPLILKFKKINYETFQANISKETTMKDLKTHNFPDLNNIEMAFSTVKTDKTLLEEAKERGFYNGHTPYNKLFSNLFFSGGKVKFKEGIQEEFKVKAWKYCSAFMASFEPKHEEKEAICALLMSELLEV